jgi:hypothetical protein
MNFIPPEPEPIATVGPMRALLKPDGKYYEYYIARVHQQAWLWDVVPEWVYRGKGRNDE